MPESKNQQHKQPPPPEDLSAFISTEVNALDKKAFPSSGDVVYSGKPSVSHSSYPNEIEYVIKQQFANSLEQNRKERVKYAKHTFIFTCIWITIVMSFVFMAGFSLNGKRLLQLSDTIIITLITTTTVNVFGFFLLVMKFLFNKEELAALGFLFNGRDAAGKTTVISNPGETDPQ